MNTVNIATDTKARFLLASLASCFGGFSQLPNRTLGEALRGHVINQGMAEGMAEEMAQAMAQALCDRWEEDNVAEVLSEILSGLKS